MTPDEYEQTIRELARRSAMPGEVAARMQNNLQQAWQPAAAPERPAARRARGGLFAAAAALVLAVGLGAWYAWRPVTVNHVTEMAGLKAGATDKETAGPKAGATEKTISAKTETTGKQVHPPPTHRPTNRLPPVIQPAGFVAVPTAARLPRFESGVIVRMVLPVTALPGYGVDISRASNGEPVEADVLVGQDGLARAIRLVNPSRSQQ